jgi:hypothetical protein
VLGAEHFPIDVTAVAREYTAQKFPSEPIVRIQGENLPGFEGALFKAPAGKKGWGVFYNNRLSSKGRINFTLAHELGHYLLHRLAYPEGIRCGEEDMVQWDSEFGKIEHQANVFSANLLMPLDDYRRQIRPADRVTLDMIAHCADSYRVSLAAATLRWLSYTDKRAVLVVSRDAFILWARSSKSALKTGAYFRTSGGPIAIPPKSLPATPGAIASGTTTMEHPANVWFAEPVVEMAMASEQYDYVFSLLSLADNAPFNFDEWRSKRR